MILSFVCSFFLFVRFFFLLSSSLRDKIINKAVIEQYQKCQQQFQLNSHRNIALLLINCTVLSCYGLPFLSEKYTRYSKQAEITSQLHVPIQVMLFGWLISILFFCFHVNLLRPLRTWILFETDDLATQKRRWNIKCWHILSKLEQIITSQLNVMATWFYVGWLSELSEHIANPCINLIAPILTWNRLFHRMMNVL